MKTTAKTPLKSGGFTLVEVTIALGICATVLIALLALLPGSLDTMRQAMNITTEARISEDIISEVQLTDWDKVQDFDGEYRYYDDQGTFLENGQNSLRQVYSARIQVQEESGIRYPGSENNAPNQFTRRLIIDIANNPGRPFPVSNPRLFRRYSAVISDMTPQEKG